MRTVEIYDWLKKRYPGGPQWTVKEFNCFRDAPLEVRMFEEMDTLEAEIGNGGLAQFLWNTFPHWRVVLEDCAAAYGMIGATAQKRAIAEFAALCLAHESACSVFIGRARRDGKLEHFSRWYEDAEESMSSDAEELFYAAAGLDGKRSAWMERNEELLRSLMDGGRR